VSIACESPTNDLKYLLGWFATHPEQINDGDVDELWDHFERLAEPLRKESK